MAGTRRRGAVRLGSGRRRHRGQLCDRRRRRRGVLRDGCHQFCRSRDRGSPIGCNQRDVLSNPRSGTQPLIERTHLETTVTGAERQRVEGFGRLDEGLRQASDWYLWGPYLSERQWGTVREDYSADGEAWSYLPHDHARSRAYRWGEDGLAGFCDIEQRMCLGLAPWNGRDPILTERIFGLTGREADRRERAK